MTASDPIPMPESEHGPADTEPGSADTDGRPDWLVGAEEGVASEHERSEREMPEVKLQRPTPLPVEGVERGGEALRPAAASTPGLPLASRSKPAAEPSGPAPPKAWTAKASSVPRLALVPAAKPTAEPEDAPAEPEREREREREIGPPARDPFGDTGLALIGAEEADTARAPVAPLDEPWWMVLVERLATDRRLLLGVVCAVAVVVAAFMLWPREGRGVSVARIEQHPEAFENQTVRVSGRVEEVFPLGQGWVYDLSQGKQTITVFTRGAMPERHAHVVVVGQVSTGYLDGKPRVAILEGAQP